MEQFRRSTTECSFPRAGAIAEYLVGDWMNHLQLPPITSNTIVVYSKGKMVPSSSSPTIYPILHLSYRNSPF